jgi:hypothetical protein
MVLHGQPCGRLGDRRQLFDRKPIPEGMGFLRLRLESVISVCGVWSLFAGDGGAHTNSRPGSYVALANVADIAKDLKIVEYCFPTLLHGSM